MATEREAWECGDRHRHGFKTPPCLRLAELEGLVSNEYLMDSSGWIKSEGLGSPTLQVGWNRTLVILEICAMRMASVRLLPRLSFGLRMRYDVVQIGSTWHLWAQPRQQSSCADSDRNRPLVSAVRLLVWPCGKCLLQSETGGADGQCDDVVFQASRASIRSATRTVVEARLGSRWSSND